MQGEEKNKNIKILRKTFVFLMLLFAFVLSFQKIEVEKNNLNPNYLYLTGEKGFSDENNEKGSILGETDSASEDFELKAITVAGETSDNFDITEEDLPLAISEIKNEVVSIREDDEIKAIISWKSNRPAISEIEYLKNGDGSPITLIEEGGYSLAHSVALSDLSSDMVYNFSIKVIDKNGEETNSDKFAFYTGAANVSVVDVLENAAGKLFGWAMKK